MLSYPLTHKQVAWAVRSLSLSQVSGGNIAQSQLPMKTRLTDGHKASFIKIYMI